jgi:hypothetical protein
MRQYFILFFCFTCINLSTAAHAEETSTEDIVAKTANGDEVILHPNGYWEFVDAQKAAVAKTKVEKIAREEGCPRGTRASFFGIGRCIANDDPALKHGSRGGKGW